MTKFNTLIKFKDGSHMYHRNHIEAFNNAKAKGLEDPSAWMYMYSISNFDYFKNINFRNYVRYPINVKSKEDIVSTYDDFYNNVWKGKSLKS
tara:strand:- start:282 stop:557 length:276 start_codon:yes stop_codon:yes gene_type:complete